MVSIWPWPLPFKSWYLVLKSGTLMRGKETWKLSLVDGWMVFGEIIVSQPPDQLPIPNYTDAATLGIYCWLLSLSFLMDWCWLGAGVTFYLGSSCQLTNPSETELLSECPSNWLNSEQQQKKRPIWQAGNQALKYAFFICFHLNLYFFLFMLHDFCFFVISRPRQAPFSLNSSLKFIECDHSDCGGVDICDDAMWGSVEVWLEQWCIMV